MGTFHVSCTIQNHVEPHKTARVPSLLVDTGSEHTWIREEALRRIGVAPQKKDAPFVMANGQTISRNIGFVIIRLEAHFTIDEVVFAQKGDLRLLGARTLEGLNFRVDPYRKKWVAADPFPAA